jgi:hypothetical protein
LLLLSSRAAAEFTLWVARPKLSLGLRLELVSARALPLAPIARLERLRARLMERREVLAVLQLQPQDRQASRRARQLRREQRQWA